jgi:hypothetical protein
VTQESPKTTYRGVKPVPFKNRDFSASSAAVPHWATTDESFIDTCKTNVRVSLFRANFTKESFVSGHDFSRAERRGKTRALAPVALFPLQFGFGAAFASSTFHEEIYFAESNSP